MRVRIVKKQKITVTLILTILIAVTISGCTTSDPNQAYAYKQTGWGEKVGAAMENQQKVNQEYLAGNITSNEFISKTKSNKKTIDNVIAEMEKTTPPSQFKQIHEISLSAYKEDSKGLQLTMQGKNLNNITFLKQATDLINQANKQLGNITRRG
jgi:hypothetical protein